MASETGGRAGATDIAHVLAPLDGSERAEAALVWLRLLPIQHVTLLQVCEDAAPAAKAEEYLADAAARLVPPGCTAATRVKIGGPAEVIVETAASADLVVMTTRGSGGGGRLLFGSVADRVARHSPTPTLLLRGGSAPVSETALRRVVVPLDGSPAAERALPLAAALATRLGAGVHLVTVDEPEQGEPDVTASSPSDGYLEGHADSLRRSGIAATTERRSGAPAAELLDVVTPGDLLVMTTHGRGSARRWQIGSVAEKLLRQAAAPVVLVRADSP